MMVRGHNVSLSKMLPMATVRARIDTRFRHRLTCFSKNFCHADVLPMESYFTPRRAATTQVRERSCNLELSLKSERQVQNLRPFVV